jgi:hypothetical protein
VPRTVSGEEIRVHSSDTGGDWPAAAITEPVAPAAVGQPTLAVADVPAGWWRRRAAAAGHLLRAEWLFALALLAGALLRLSAELGFRPIMWFNDGLEYLGVALRWQANPVRPDGYSAFLRLLLPFHSFALVAALQHLMGLAAAVLLYALLRRWRVPGPLATLGVLPQLLDVHQVELEHLVMSDTLFTFLLVAAVVLLGWQRRAAPLTAGAAGLMLALAALTRSVGLPLVVLGGIYLLARWPGWRPMVAYTLLALLPLGSYAVWYHHEHGSYGFGTADGVYLYSRVMVFANCAVIKPPADLAVLCRQPSQPDWPVSSDYIWHASPLDRLPGQVSNPPVPVQLFTPKRNRLALRFAVQAIASQPLSYLQVGLRDFARSFGWSRQPFPNAAVVHDYMFSRRPYLIRPSRIYVFGGTAGQDMASYQNGDTQTRVVGPYAGVMIGLQRFVFLPGPVLAVLLAIGLAGLLAPGRDDRRWQVLLLWSFALALLLIPPFTAQFDYRYVLPAVPLASAAAVIAIVILVPRWSGPEGKGDAAGQLTRRPGHSR